MASITDICNLALGELGEKFIVSLEEQTKAARICSVFYAQKRDELLRMHRWNFAAERKTLARLTAAPDFGWTYAYQLPSDFLRVDRVNELDEFEARELYEIEGGKLLSDQETIRLKYVRRIEDSNLFDPLFTQALYLHLAASIAVNLSGDAGLAEKFERKLSILALPAARRIDAAEGHPSQQRKQPRVDSRLVRARHGYS